MSQKKKDDKNRWRSLTIAFRVSPEENEELNMRVKLSGAETKQEYIIQSVLHQQVIAKRESTHACDVPKRTSAY